MTVLCENIDPNGDTLIIVPYSTVSSESSDDSVTEESSHIEDPRSESGHEPDTEVDRSMPSSIGEATHSDEGADPVTELWFKVSRNHLTVASRRARKMFQGEYLETQKSEIDGCYHWKMEPLFDPEALGLVLRIIHARNQDLPEGVTLEMLVSIGKVVDDLQCHEALSFFAKAWTSRISQPIPTHMCDELIQWIFIASVFGLNEQFKKATKTAMMESTGQIDSLGLPILSKTVDRIEKSRQHLLKDLADQLHTSLGRLCSGIICSSPQCTCVMIGALAKQMNDLELLSPRSSTPFSGMSLSSAFKAVRRFDSPPLYLPPERGTQQLHSLLLTPLAVFERSLWLLQKDMSGYNRGLLDSGEMGQMEQTKSTIDTPQQLEVHKCRLQNVLQREINVLRIKASFVDLGHA